MSISQRSILPNMMAEMGAKNSVILPDEAALAYLAGRARRTFEVILPDEEAAYAQSYTYQAKDLEPMIACPHTVDNVQPLSKVAGTKVQQAFLGTCTNGRLEDLATAAEVLKGRKLAPGTRMVIIPASSQVYLEAVKAGYIETFIEAGAVVESPGCGPCMGNHMGVPAVGEVSISTANRNFRGRMGTKESDIYLASPAVVAATAVAGEITHPKDL
jgi:homoaconitase/3-isopropylmalate dehydratase large subunit